MYKELSLVRVQWMEMGHSQVVVLDGLGQVPDNRIQMPQIRGGITTQVCREDVGHQIGGWTWCWQKGAPLWQNGTRYRSCSVQNLVLADPKAPDSKIKLDDWVEHFSSILSPQEYHNYENVNFDGELSENEYLDGPRTETEIIYAIENLKHGKSPGIDELTVQFF